MTRIRNMFLGSRGLTMTMVLPLMLILLAFAAALLQLTRGGLHFSAMASARQKSFYIADGGLQSAMSRLYADRQTAAINASYTASDSGSIGGGSFAYSVIQDPMYPLDPTRKQVSATGEIAGGSSTVVSQVVVYPFSSPAGPTCDWMMFANRGVTEIINAAPVATDLINGNVHSNNDVRVTTVTGAGVNGSGRFESVNRTIVQALDGSPFSTMNASLYRGTSFVTAGILSDVHRLNGSPLLGIHFANGSRSHGEQAPVSSIPMPTVDWTAIEQTPEMTIVDADHVPFGSWDDDTDTWVIRARHVFPGDNSAKYFVRGSVKFRGVVLARSTQATIAALGSIEINELSLLQTTTDGILGIGLSTAQTLQLWAKGKPNAPANVYIGRGLLQTASVALGDASLPGINFTAPFQITNQIGAYSETGDVWVKASSISVFAKTKLNLVGDGDSTFATTASIASSPTTFCQMPVT